MTIGTLRETDLHAALKRYYARPGDQLDVSVDGYVVDILRDHEIVEIQTHNFSALKRKLPRLLDQYRVRLVHPLPIEKWIVRLEADRRTRIGRRKSPQRGELIDLFLELVSLPGLIAHPNFTLEIVLIHEEEIRCPFTARRRARWKKQWRTINRRLLKVVDCIEFSDPTDFQRFIPATLAMPFTSGELAAALDQPAFVAHKVTYCLRQMGVLDIVGKRRNAWLYAKKELDTD